MSDKSRKFIGPDCTKRATAFIKMMANKGCTWVFGMNTHNLSIVVRKKDE